MSDVQFEDQGQEFTSRKIFGESVKPKMVARLMKMGIVKNDKQAGYALLTIAIIAFSLSLFFFGKALLPKGNQIMVPPDPYSRPPTQ